MINKTAVKNSLKAAVIPALLILLCAVILIAVDTIAGVEVSASASADQIGRLREEKAEYERQKKEVNEKIEALEFERLAELDKKEVLDERIILTGMEITNLNEIINQYKLLISEKEYEVIIAQNREEEQLNKYKSRVRYLEESGLASYLEIIFDSTSIMDFLARVDFVTSIISADEDAYIRLQQAREVTLAARDELEGIKSELDEEYANMEALQEELEEQLAQSHAMILRLEANIETEIEYRERIAEEEARVQSQIYAVEAQIRREREAALKEQQEKEQAEQKAAQEKAGEQNPAQEDDGKTDSGAQDSGEPSDTGGTGNLMWPVSGTIISNYGMRSGRMHQGIDISAAHGTPIVAADGGTVLTSAYGSGYGNYIVISHGNGMTTLYSHLSSRSVSAGATVSKGQQIGLAGSTGNATCSHLHFEVSVDGVRVNPISKL